MKDPRLLDQKSCDIQLRDKTLDITGPDNLVNLKRNGTEGGLAK